MVAFFFFASMSQDVCFNVCVCLLDCVQMNMLSYIGVDTFDTVVYSSRIHLMKTALMFKIPLCAITDFCTR